MRRVAISISGVLLIGGWVAVASAHAQGAPRTPAQSVRAQFTAVNGRILEMAKDFPEEKYSFRPTPEVRTFQEVIVHVLSGNVYAAKAGRGEKASWDEVDAKEYKTKTAVVAALEKSIQDANATLKGLADDRLAASLEPWLPVLEHSAEHYGQLVVYYRVNGLVPPESRPKK